MGLYYCRTGTATTTGDTYGRKGCGPSAVGAWQRSPSMWSNGQTILCQAGPPDDPPSGVEHTVAKVVYIGDTGQEYAVDAATGDSVMATAVKHGVPGIIGECGGNASCGTCHVWVHDDFADLVGQPGDMEDDLLDLGASDRRETSRLSCQIEVTPALDGLTVVIPPDQP